MLRRYVHSDQPQERVLARTALARIDREAGHPARAQTWVQEYSAPIEENYAWPRVGAAIEYAESTFAQGQTFDAVKRLNGIKDHAQGLGRIHAQRALSRISEQQPDVRKALAFEKEARSTGARYYKREKISDSAGWADPKPGHDQWQQLKPEIDDRIQELQRLLDIEQYGLDYVLYREAQNYRKASHPLAMDFTHVAAAFRLKEPMANKVPGAEYEKALESYALLIESFAQNPYAEAAKLYSAVCKVHMGEADQAIRDLKAFYKENPDGLYRGEALKIIGDIYLFHKWDQTNAEEAYNRAVKWLEAMKGRSRVLNDYLVPEKSQKVSKPPVKVKVLTEEGLIKDIAVPSNALVNRNASRWYLDHLRVEVEWRLGFLDIIEGKWDASMAHFEQVKIHDRVIKKADDNNIFNAYHRLQAARRHEALVATKEQLVGLQGKERYVVMWADLNFLIENFEMARFVYGEIAESAEGKKRNHAHARGILGKILVKRELEGIDGVEDVAFLNKFVAEYPDNTSAPVLLEICATYSLGEPLDRGGFLKRIYTEYPNSIYARNARYYEVLHVPELHDLSLRRKLIEEFKRDFPNEAEYHEILEDYYIWFVEQLKEQNEAMGVYQ